MNMQWSMMPPTLYASWVPMWVEILITILLVAGGVITLIGSLGLLRMNDFFQRLHGPSMGNTLGAFCILLSSTLFFSFSREKLSLHEVLILVFILTTPPVVGMLLARAALYRKHSAALSAQVKARREASGIGLVKAAADAGTAASPAAAAASPKAHATAATTGLPTAVRPSEHPGGKASSSESLEPDRKNPNNNARRPE